MSMSSKITALKLGLDLLEGICRSIPSPYATGILTGAKSVVETVLNSSENDQVSQRLAERALEISTACVNALPKEGLPREFQTTYHIGHLMKIMSRITQKLMKQTQRGRLTKLVLKSSDASSLKELGDELEKCAEMLSFHLQMENLHLSDRLAISNQLQESEIEQAVAEAQKKELELIRSHFIARTIEKIGDSLLPPTPHIFHGRSEDTHRILNILLRDEASYVCILGTGGIGKTSLGLAALHCPEVIKIYHSYRYFVPCDSLTDDAALLTTLASLFRVVEKHFWKQFPELCGLLKSKILLMLDNFETPWEHATSRKNVETFLSKLADIPNLSIILTLRGSERPYGIPWTRPFLNALTTLDLASAKQTFVEISDVSEDSIGLDELLHAVDMLPLAVTLLANQAQSTNSCSELLDLWNDQKTKMVTRGIEDRISSLDVSIQLSLASPRLSQFPDALTILRILSVLPDGADNIELKELLSGKYNTAAIAAVIRVGLAYRNEAGWLRSLAPVREHLQIFRPMDSKLFHGIATFYNDLAKFAYDAFYWKDDRASVNQRIAPQLGNIHSVLALSLEKMEFQKDAVGAIAHIHYYHRTVNFRPNRSLLNNALVTARLLGDPVLEVDCLLSAYWFESTDRAKLYINSALGICRTLGDPFRLTNCLEAITTLYMLTDPKRVIAAATEITDNLHIKAPEAVNNNSMASAYTSLIGTHCERGDMQTAWSLARKAMTIPGLKGAAKATILFCMANLYGSCGELTASLKCSLQSVELLDGLDDFRSFVSYEDIAQVYFMQSRLSLAGRAMARAASIRESTRSGYTQSAQGPYCAARIAILIGDTALALSKCQTIHSIYLRGDGRSIYTQPFRLQRLLSCALAELEMSANNWPAALIHVESAEASERALGWVSSGNQAESLIRRADLIAAMEIPSRSLNPSILAAILCSRQGDCFGFSMALQRIGDVFFSDGEKSHAKGCYVAELEVIQDPNLNMGANRHIADCLLRLGMVAGEEGIPHEARAYFERARESYVVAESTDGVDFCQSRIKELQDSETMSSKSFSLLPLGNRLFMS